MYRERVSRLPGAVVWTADRAGGTTRILPDGCMDLIWNGTSLVIAGPDTRAHVVTNDPEPASIAAIRFAPGTAPAILGVSAVDLRDQRVPVSAVWSAARARCIGERLALAADPAALIETVAWELACVAPAPAPLVAAVTALTRRSDDVEAIAAAVGMSSRQLRRRCIDAYGYGPKTLSRILRMQRALALTREHVPQATTAAIAGYADQAHMSREIKVIAGATLGELTR